MGTGTDDRVEIDQATAPRIIAEAAAAQEADGLTDGEVAGILGYKAPTWNQAKHGNYPGDVVEIARQCRRWLQDRADRPGADVPFVETAQARRILGVCMRARKRRMIGLVIGPSGCGKTMALTEFKRRVGNGAIYVRAGQASATPLLLIDEIRRQLALRRPVHGTFAEIYRLVRERLADAYAGGAGVAIAILVDEATALTPAALNVLRDLHDDAATRAPLVLADTWRLDGELHSRRGFAGGYEQLRSRAATQYRQDRHDYSEADVEAVARAAGGRALPRGGLRYLLELAGGDGGLLAVRNRVEAVIDVAEAMGTRPRFTAAELDAASPWVGARCRRTDAGRAFSDADGGDDGADQASESSAAAGDLRRAG